MVLDTVPRFDELFDLYKNEEYDFMVADSTRIIWDKDILDSSSYWEYTNGHLKELIRLRLMPIDWPEKLLDPLLYLNGKELMVLANMENHFSEDELKALIKEGTVSTFWQHALNLTEIQLKRENLNLDDFEGWDGQDLIADFYRIKNADRLALKDICKKRMSHYNKLMQSLILNLNNPTIEPLREFATVFEMLTKGAPADHFLIDLEQGDATAID